MNAAEAENIMQFAVLVSTGTFTIGSYSLIDGDRDNPIRKWARRAHDHLKQTGEAAPAMVRKKAAFFSYKTAVSFTLAVLISLYFVPFFIAILSANGSLVSYPDWHASQETWFAGAHHGPGRYIAGEKHMIYDNYGSAELTDFISTNAAPSGTLK